MTTTNLTTVLLPAGISHQDMTELMCIYFTYPSATGHHLYPFRRVSLESAPSIHPVLSVSSRLSCCISLLFYTWGVVTENLRPTLHPQSCIPSFFLTLCSPPSSVEAAENGHWDESSAGHRGPGSASGVSNMFRYTHTHTHNWLRSNLFIPVGKFNCSKKKIIIINNNNIQLIYRTTN